MPENTTVMWSLQEMITVLIKAAGIHEGYWILNVNITHAVGTFASPVSGKNNPGGLFVIERVGLSRVEVPTELAVDAAVVNPGPGLMAEASVSTPPRPGSN